MANYGQQMPEANIKKDLIRKILYYNADLLSIGTKVSPTMQLADLDIKFDYPSDLSGQYPVADDAIGAREKVTWNQFSLALKKAHIHYFITDSAKLRNVAGTQNVINARKGAEALAKLKDEEILERIYAGAGATSVAASAVWTGSSADPEVDVMSAWTNVLHESNVTREELKKLALLVPTEAMAYINKLTLIGNVQRTVQDYLKTAYGITVYPTRSEQLGASASTDAILMVEGDMTSRHGVLSARAAAASGVPLVEKVRVEGSGDDYLVTQWFRTVIMDDASGTNTTYRICKITDVCT